MRILLVWIILNLFARPQCPCCGKRRSRFRIRYVRRLLRRTPCPSTLVGWMRKHRRCGVCSILYYNRLF